MKNIIRKSILLLSLLLSALPSQNPLVASAASFETQESDLSKPIISTLVRTEEDLEKYNVEGPDYGSIFSFERPDSIGHQYSYKYLPSYGTQEYNYWDGLTSHTLKWKAAVVTHVERGVYATFDLPFLPKEVLETGTFADNVVCTYELASDLNILFAEKHYWNFLNMANYYVLESYESGELQPQEGLNFLSGVRYSYKIEDRHSFNASLYLNEESAAYCPDGWMISLGLICEYYVVDFEYQDFTNWWWGQQPTNGASLAMARVVIADERAMDFGYIYKRVGASENSLGLGDYRFLALNSAPIG